MNGFVNSSQMPTLKLDFANSTALDPRITFSRASSATFTGSDGLLQTAAVDAPRLTYNPTTLAAEGLLVEEQRTNLLLQSEAFDNAAWVKVNATVTANAAIAPDGSLSADTITLTASLGFLGESVTVTQNTQYAVTFWVERGTATDLKYSVYNHTGLTDIIAPTTYFSSTSPTGWARISLVFTTPTGCTSVRVYPARDTGVTGTFNVWGAQLEAGAFATSYIPTTTAQATRAADVAVMTGTNFSSWYNATAGTLLVDGTINTPSATAISVAIDDGSATNRLRIGRLSGGNAFGGFASAASGTVNVSTANSITLGTAYKAAFTFAAGDIAVVLNAGTAATGTPAVMPVGMQAMILGANGPVGAQSQYANGNIKSITYYPRRLANTELVSLTS